MFNLPARVWNLGNAVKTGDDDPWGMAFDGTHAVATDGIILAAVPFVCDAWPPTWRFRPVWPSVLASSDEVFLPDMRADWTKLGYAGAKTRNKKDVVYEIVDVKKPFPAWRRAVATDVVIAGDVIEPAHVQRFAVPVVTRLLAAASFLNCKYIELFVNPDGLNPVQIRGDCSDATAFIMPCTKV